MSDVLNAIATLVVGALALSGVIYAQKVAKRASERQSAIEERLGTQRETREDFTTLYDRLEGQLKQALSKINDLERRLDDEVTARERAEQRANRAEERANRAERRADIAEREVARLKLRVQTLEDELATAKAALRIAYPDDEET